MVVLGGVVILRVIVWISLYSIGFVWLISWICGKALAGLAEENVNRMNRIRRISVVFACFLFISCFCFVFFIFYFLIYLDCGVLRVLGSWLYRLDILVGFVYTIRLGFYLG